MQIARRLPGSQYREVRCGVVGGVCRPPGAARIMPKDQGTTVDAQTAATEGDQTVMCSRERKAASRARSQMVNTSNWRQQRENKGGSLSSPSQASTLTLRALPAHSRSMFG